MRRATSKALEKSYPEILFRTWSASWFGIVMARLLLEIWLTLSHPSIPAVTTFLNTERRSSATPPLRWNRYKCEAARAWQPCFQFFSELIDTSPSPKCLRFDRKLIRQLWQHRYPSGSRSQQCSAMMEIPFPCSKPPLCADWIWLPAAENGCDRRAGVLGRGD